MEWLIKILQKRKYKIVIKEVINKKEIFEISPNKLNQNIKLMTGFRNEI